MRILQISDTHNRHHQLTDLPPADVIIHCGDFTENGTDAEVLDFLNWLIALPYQHKIFVTGNHDICLWDATGIEDLPDNVHFLQDCGIEIDGVRFWGLAYNHPEILIPSGVDVLVTHEPPAMILDYEVGTHWGNAYIRNRTFEVPPRYHLFGHVHENYGVIKEQNIIFSNGAMLDYDNNMLRKPRLFHFSIE